MITNTNDTKQVKTAKGISDPEVIEDLLALTEKLNKYVSMTNDYNYTGTCLHLNVLDRASRKMQFRPLKLVGKYSDLAKLSRNIQRLENKLDNSSAKEIHIMKASFKDMIRSVIKKIKKFIFGKEAKREYILCKLAQTTTEFFQPEIQAYEDAGKDSYREYSKNIKNDFMSVLHNAYKYEYITSKIRAAVDNKEIAWTRELYSYYKKASSYLEIMANDLNKYFEQSIMEQEQNTIQQLQNDVLNDVSVPIMGDMYYRSSGKRMEELREQISDFVSELADYIETYQLDVGRIVDAIGEAMTKEDIPEHSYTDDKGKVNEEALRSILSDRVSLIVNNDFDLSDDAFITGETISEIYGGINQATEREIMDQFYEYESTYNEDVPLYGEVYSDEMIVNMGNVMSMLYGAETPGQSIAALSIAKDLVHRNGDMLDVISGEIGLRKEDLENEFDALTDGDYIPEWENEITEIMYSKDLFDEEYPKVPFSEEYSGPNPDIATPNKIKEYEKGDIPEYYLEKYRDDTKYPDTYQVGNSNNWYKLAQTRNRGYGQIGKYDEMYTLQGPYHVDMPAGVAPPADNLDLNEDERTQPYEDESFEELWGKKETTTWPNKSKSKKKPGQRKNTNKAKLIASLLDRLDKYEISDSDRSSLANAVSNIIRIKGVDYNQAVAILTNVAERLDNGEIRSKDIDAIVKQEVVKLIKDERDENSTGKNHPGDIGMQGRYPGFTPDQTGTFWPHNRDVSNMEGAPRPFGGYDNLYPTTGPRGASSSNWYRFSGVKVGDTGGLYIVVTLPLPNDEDVADYKGDVLFSASFENDKSAIKTIRDLLPSPFVEWYIYVFEDEDVLTNGTLVYSNAHESVL